MSVGLLVAVGWMVGSWLFVGDVGWMVELDVV